MAQDVQMSHGSPLMAPYVPGADHVSGEVVLLGDLPGITHTVLVTARNSDLAVGGGVYRCTADAVIAVGKKVFWDATAKKVTETSAGNKHFGTTIEAAGGDDDIIMVHHHPDGTEGS